MASAWSLCAAWPSASERLVVTCFASVLHAVCLYVSCGLFVAADRLGFWRRYRLPRQRPDLRPDTEHNVSLNRAAFWEQLLGASVVVPIALYAAAPLLSSRIAVCAPLPSVRSFCVDFWLMIVGCDTCFYWVHRTLHWPAFYRAVHKKHHEYKATTVWASEYFGVIDLVLNVLPGVLPAVALRSHFTTLMAFTAFRQWQTVQSHAGYDLPFDPTNRGVFHGGARRHDFHHTHNHGCFADFLPFWDWACGTDKAYSKYWRENRHLATYPI